MNHLTTSLTAIVCLFIGGVASPVFFNSTSRPEEQTRVELNAAPPKVPANSEPGSSKADVAEQSVEQRPSEAQKSFELQLRKIVSNLEQETESSPNKGTSNLAAIGLKNIEEQLALGILPLERAKQMALKIATAFKSAKLRQQKQASKRDTNTTVGQEVSKSSSNRASKSPVKQRPKSASKYQRRAAAATSAKTQRSIQAKYDKLKTDIKVLTFNMQQAEEKHERKLLTYSQREAKIGDDYVDGRINKKAWRFKLDQLDTEKLRYKQSEAKKKAKSKSHIESFRREMSKIASRARAMGFRVN